MKYLIVQDWSSTRGNHAGMEHMCDLLVKMWPDQYVKICKSEPQPLPQRNLVTRRLFRKIDFFVFHKKWVKEYMLLCDDMFKQISSDDEVFLLEYNWPDTSQLEIAQHLRKINPDIKIRALAHITPTLYKRIHAQKFIKQWSQFIDTLMTMGSGLSNYFKECGVPENKINTGFHYVDLDFYKISHNPIQIKDKITIIAMGALQRDFKLLAEIVNALDEVEWIICIGRKQVQGMFHGNNVTLVGYVEENELKIYMDQADVSINVLEDTVGSNVITTSMAMGLGIIVSDVGSIRDYCDESNAIFCNNSSQSFITAIRNLIVNPNKVKQMRQASLEKAKQFSINEVHNWFSNL